MLCGVDFWLRMSRGGRDRRSLAMQQLSFLERRYPKAPPQCGTSSTRSSGQKR